MRRLRFVLIALLALVAGSAASALACSPPGAPPPAEAPGWATFEPSAAFTFLGPADLEPVPLQGIDSRVGRYANDALTLSYDYGWYSDPLEPDGSMGYASQDTEIDGKSARLVRYPGHVAVHFPVVEDRVKLTVVIALARDDAASDALEILRSIRFR